MVDFPLHVHPFRHFVSLVTVDILARGDQVLLDAGERVVLSDLQVDEFVRDDAHLLKGEGLHTGSGETLDDPAHVLLLVLVNLLLNQLDHDIVVDYNTFENGC